MTALLVERAGRRVAMAGNVGPTMLDTLAARWSASARELARGLGAGAVVVPARRRDRVSSPPPPPCST
jgi:UDP-N-acetylmuramoylalanine--D-glutamate ligase